MSADRLVFITGASSGIGQALAARYLQAGWRVALVARRGDALRAWAAERGLDAQRCGVYEADVQQVDSIAAAGQACIQAQGLPDVVIANAGISVGMDTAHRADIDALKDTLATNVAAGWWALPAWPPFAACPAMARTAPASRPWWPIAKACAASAARLVCRCSPCCPATSPRR